MIELHPLSPPETKKFPKFAIEHTLASCPTSLVTNRPLVVSNTYILKSLEPKAICLPELMKIAHNRELEA